MKPIISETEKQKNDAWSFIRCQVKAQKLMRKHFQSLGSVHALNLSDMIHLSEGAVALAELTGLEWAREDWEGNEMCGSNWDIVYFDYAGYRFFELVFKDTVYDKESV